MVGEYIDISSKGRALHNLVLGFMEDNRITCAETVYQCDHAIENAHEFIDQLCEIVGYPEPEE